MSCPIQRFLYCSNFYSTGYIHIYTHIYIYTVKSQPISHTTWKRLYIEQGVLNVPNPMKVRFRWICDLMVRWNQIKVDKLGNLSPLHELFSAVFWRCIHLHYFSFSCILVGSLLFLAFHYGICKSFITTESGNFLRFKEKKKLNSRVKSCRGKTTTRDYFYHYFPNKERSHQPIYLATLLIF